MDLLADLNEAQRRAVTHVDGPLLVLAGAGSGKTRVITRRVAYLIAQGVAPWHILAITFTNKAANEMKQRIRALGTPAGATIGTFHALCARLLREFADQARLPRSFTIYDQDDERVRRMIELQRQAYQQGVPAYGSCWGLQIAVVAAGGQVAKNPRGREMGLARKIVLTGQGRAHPFLRDKPPVFDAFISHYDEVTTLPPGAVLLAGNDFTRVQAAEVRHAAGTFWAVQYHPEYSLHDMARLIVARRQRLLDEGFFTDEIAFQTYVTDLETLHDQPERRDLRWRLGIDDDVLDPSRRQLEFRNWLERLVLPGGPR